MGSSTKPDVEKVVDYALLKGLIKKNSKGRVVHAPFALSPCPIEADTSNHLEELTPPFNSLVYAVSRSPEFLRETLAEVTITDEFTRELISLLDSSSSHQPLNLLITRGDYFLQSSDLKDQAEIRQVELNTISAGYLGLAGIVCQLHRHLLANNLPENTLLPNDPLKKSTAGFLEAFKRYGHPEAFLLMVVQPGETNIFDQRLLELALFQENIDVLRMTLEEIASEGAIKEGHLKIGGRIAAIAYFRAGYAPEDFFPTNALKGRTMIENSSAIKVPNLAVQLAGTKRVQQQLTKTENLHIFSQPDQISLLETTFAGIFDLEDPVTFKEDALPAWQAAQAEPHRFVLKPQREGGGNNLFGEEMKIKLVKMSVKERKAYILMERIFPIPHHAVLVRDGKLHETICVSEIGRFGVLLAENDEILMNFDAGYLVRTKGLEDLEGGVSAGFGYLNSLIVSPKR